MMLFFFVLQIKENTKVNLQQNTKEVVKRISFNESKTSESPNEMKFEKLAQQTH